MAGGARENGDEQAGEQRVQLAHELVLPARRAKRVSTKCRARYMHTSSARDLKSPDRVFLIETYSDQT